MKYILSSRFQIEFKEVVDYPILEFGKNSALKFSQQVQTKLKWVIENPEIGRIEPLLATRQTPIRSIIVSRYNKAIYYVSGDILYVTDLWDMRRDPQSLQKRIKKQ